METKFIEQLVMAVPESLRETTLALQTEVEELLKAKSTKKFLVLEPYSRNTELCRHILRRMEKLPELPSVSCKEYRPLLMLLSLSKEVEIQNDLLHHFVEPYRKAYRTPEMLYLCEVLYHTGTPQPLYNMCNEVCDYFFVERRKQISRQYTPLTELDFQFAEKRLKPLLYFRVGGKPLKAAVCRRVPDEGEPLQLPDAQCGGTRRNVLHERFDLP